MDWRDSYHSSWRIFRVNRDTWADAEQVTNIDSVNITRTADGDLLESGSMSISGDFETDYYRIVMTAERGGDVQRVDVGTLLFDSASGVIDFGTTTRDAEGYSVLYPASVTLVYNGEYAPAGVDGAEYVHDMLTRTINAPVHVDGHFTLNEHVVFDVGSSVLEACWLVLDAGNFVMQIDGRGEVHILPKPSEPALVIDTGNIGLLENGIEYTEDISEIPNRYIVIEGNSKTVASNDNPESIVSTISRGYNVDEIDESATPVNGETLGEYALRRLHEMSIMTSERSYTREYQPNVYLYDVIRGSIDGLFGDYRITNQTINCEHGVVLEETANREVSLF